MPVSRAVRSLQVPSVGVSSAPEHGVPVSVRATGARARVLQFNEVIPKLM